jgi:hypothetical protein
MDISNNETPVETIETFNIDDFLEIENQQNKKETWTKLNRTIRIQLLHSYAEKYSKTHNLNLKETKQLKRYLTDILDAKKLNKIKDVSYDREKGIITNITHLHFHPSTRMFTLRSEPRVSTLNALGPRKTEKKKKNEQIGEN